MNETRLSPCSVNTSQHTTVEGELGANILAPKKIIPDQLGLNFNKL